MSQSAAARKADPGRVRAVFEMILSDDLARRRAVRLHHSPEALTRSPAKVEILVNSLLVFVEHGVAQVTVQDLLDSAGISRRTFYKYFRNKIDVLESLYKLAVDFMMLRFKASLGSASSVAEVANGIVDNNFDYHLDLGEVIRLMQEEAIRSDSPLAAHRREAMDTMVELVNEELQRIAGRRVDRLAVQALMWAMESTSLELLRNGIPTPEQVAHDKRVMTLLVEASLRSALDA